MKVRHMAVAAGLGMALAVSPVLGVSPHSLSL